MPTELYVLALAALLQVVQFVLMSIPANLELGPKKTLSPRDDLKLEEEVSPQTARLFRAMNNHFEALILFAIAVVVVVLGEKSSWLTAACAHVYLIARIIYVPLYAAGAVPWRSIVWMIGFGATVVMLLAALL